MILKGAKALNKSIDLIPKDSADSVCKLWFGSTASIAYQVDADKINSDFRNQIDSDNWLLSKNLLARKDVWNQYNMYNYNNNGYIKTGKEWDEPINDDTLGILCIKQE